MRPVIVVQEDTGCRHKATLEEAGSISDYPTAGVFPEREILGMNTILLIILVLLVLGALPTWPYSSGWGYYPSGGLGLVLVILLILVLLGKL